LWEDNLVQLRFPMMPGGANTVSLQVAQQNYVDCGAAEQRNAGAGREPVDGELRENSWRPLDMVRDNVEQPQRGIKYAESYPDPDTTVLYYWRNTYWRRVAG